MYNMSNRMRNLFSMERSVLPVFEKPGIDSEAEEGEIAAGSASRYDFFFEKGKRKGLVTMKKNHKRGVKILTVALASAMVFTSVLPAAQGIESSPVTSGVSTQAMTGEELAVLVNPVVQQYTVDDSAKTWAMTTETRLAVLATQENVANDRLAEVIQLVNSEFMEKEVVSANPFAMIYANEQDVGPADVLIVLDKENPICEDSDSEEAYRIEIGENGVKITAASENAVMYALRTIQNYMVANDGLPYGTIVDYPDVAERRLHVDCARKYISKDWFIRQIREMSFLKMNTIQMHFSENLGFRIECETDPAIVSDEYLTKDEVREILEEARKYGIKVIPSFDSPGHVDQILKAHPEYGQISNKGTHYPSGLDVTNPEAVAYIRSLYDEYMELFEGCTDFHIGGDEYMEFDRAPFTTEYKSVLNDYAKETLGPDAQWKDVLANYINELAEYVYSKGFKPRVWNDGLYYGETSYEGPQIIDMHKYIGIDFWSQMGWNRDIAKLKVFVDKGHEDIYNVNASFFYYVLRNDVPTDGRPQHSFDVPNQDKNIFENWSPGNFQSNTLDDNHPYIKGVSMAIWCDNASVCDEDTITSDIADELRCLATRSWNVGCNKDITFEQFQENYQVLGNVAGFEKGSELPDSGEFQSAESLGKVTLKYVSDTGKTLKNDVVKYGNIGNEYSFTADEIYGYKLVSEGTVTGTYSKEGDEYTFTYTLDCNKDALKAELDAALDEALYIPATFTEYKAALEAAQAVYDKADSEQTEVDDALKALTDAKAKAVLLKNFALYVETQYPLSDIGYQSGYTEYQAAVSAAEEVLFTQGNDAEAIQAALDSINTAKEALMLPDGNKPTVTATDTYYQSYSYDKMLDGNLNTKCWFEKDQEAGKQFAFTFPKTVSMSQIRIVQPSDVKDDVIEGAEVQVASDDGGWLTVGQLDNTKLDATFEFDPTPVKSVRVLLTATKKNWYQISEVYFTYEQIPEDTTVKDIIAEAEALDVTGKDAAAVNAMLDALIEVQKLYAAGSTETADAVAALREAIDALNGVVAADKTALQEAIADAAQYDEADYTKASWAAFTDALAKANEVNDNREATQEEVDAAAEALKAAIAGLEEYVAPNKTLLQKTYDHALTLSTEGVTDSAKKFFEDAVAAAKAVLDDPKATQEEVNTAWDNLLKGIWGLGITQGDKTMLEQLIVKADDMVANENKYVKDNWQQLLDALEAAKAVMEDGDALDEDIQPVAEALLEAILAQRFKADKSNLEDLIAKAEAIDLSKYTEESVAVFRAAFKAANAVLANESLSEDDQAVVDKAVSDLEAAIENLSANTDDTNKPDGDKDDTSKPDDGKGDTSKPDDGKGDPNTSKDDGKTNAPTTGDHTMPLAAAGLALTAAGALVVLKAKKRNGNEG